MKKIVNQPLGRKQIYNKQKQKKYKIIVSSEESKIKIIEKYHY
jgi:hypothetical protein